MQIMFCFITNSMEELLVKFDKCKDAIERKGLKVIRGCLKLDDIACARTLRSSRNRVEYCVGTNG